MGPKQEVPGLELTQSPTIQKWSWRIERFAWVVFAIILLLTVAGLFGSGPLSRAHAEAEGFRVEYERFCLISGPLDVRLLVAPERIQSRRVRLGINTAFLRAFHIEGVSPQPEYAHTQDGFHYMTFLAEESPHEQEVIFHLRAKAIGKTSAVFRLEEGPELTFGVFVYP